MKAASNSLLPIAFSTEQSECLQSDRQTKINKRRKGRRKKGEKGGREEGKKKEGREEGN